MISIECVMLYWFRCSLCGYESDEFDNANEVEAASDRHVCTA